MSKDIPEVGDVWRNKTSTKKYYVVSVSNKYVYCLVKGLGISTKYYGLFQNYTYLGKSKANVEQLFEVEDNGRCIEDNTPHAESSVLFKDLENE